MRSNPFFLFCPPFLHTRVSHLGSSLLPRFYFYFAGPFKHTLTVVPVSKSGEESSAGGDGVIAHYRAESTHVALSCGGVFEPLTSWGGGCEEEFDFWSEEFEDYSFAINQFAESLETRAAKLRL